MYVWERGPMWGGGEELRGGGVGVMVDFVSVV